MKKLTPRPGGSYHLPERLLTDLGYYNLGHTLLTKVSKQEQNQSQSLFAGIEKLVDQVLFVPDVSCQQIRYEQIGEHMLPVSASIIAFL